MGDVGGGMTELRRRILVVEDDEFLIMDLEITLSEEGYEVICAATIDEALERIKEHPLDGALLDVNLHGNHRSFSIADALVDAAVPFAFLTGRSRGYLPERFRERKIVAKPYRLDEVLDALAEIAGAPTGRP